MKATKEYNLETLAVIKIFSSLTDFRGFFLCFCLFFIAVFFFSIIIRVFKKKKKKKKKF